MDGDARVDFSGLMIERLPSGNTRCRVRMKGDKARKITLPVNPDHPDFADHYRAARAGERLSVTGVHGPDRGTLGWLVALNLERLSATVAAGQASPLT
ncbi:hypothetical protein SAMN04488020_101281 [Palleronia marisminoris]|uniref:Uncharacterized protein n=1 Tax=Palleronia marisminoris TaxID=315423 RepID=A0A1Y5RDA6_9RHOB|nr:hypothetical protein SAMN04488020_101281 [Palleronia marisminoris]SLN14739.1 hypothetical protein PAM7066_00282 [Palleronia marisminoris]